MPTVYFTTSQFNENAHLSAEDNGVPNMRIVAVAADKFYRERISRERARPVAEEYFDKMIASLTTPITAEEKRPKKQDSAGRVLKVNGTSMEDALENFNDMFLSNRWSDGLPVVAPTPERVKWMLTGTSRAPDEKIGTISPRNGMATIEKVAINAVMAGAKPEYLPVIIAAVEGLADPIFDDLHFATSTGSFNLLIAVSGPIAEEIGMNNGLGMFSYGNRANSTIGRAIRLSIINFGQTWPAMNDMALVGRANPHTFLVFAENQAQSPWSSYVVDQGYEEGDSTITLSVYGMGAPQVHGGGAVALVPPENIVNTIINDIKTSARGRVMNTPNGPASRFGRSHGKLLIIMNPEVAQELHDRLGYKTRESLIQHIHDEAGVPFEELNEAEIASVKQAIESGYIPKHRAAAFEAGLKPGGKVPSMRELSDVQLVVAGGIPGYTLTMRGYLDGIYKPKSHITKMITGATQTKAGTSKPVSLSAR
jgi:hypothetical protein